MPLGVDHAAYAAFAGAEVLLQPKYSNKQVSNSLDAAARAVSARQRTS